MKRRKTYFALLTVGMVIGMAISYWKPSLPHDWRLTHGMITPRWDNAAICLKDGRVLVLGGNNLDYWGSGVQTCELFDPVHETWSPAGSLRYGCGVHVLLADGRVLVCDEMTNKLLPGKPIPPGWGKIPMASWHIFDPKTNTWSPVADPSFSSYDRVKAILPLKDGRVFAYYYSETGSIYDPSTDSWSILPSCPKNLDERVPLDDGRFLGIGDKNNQLFDPQKGTLSPSAPLSSSLGWGALLPNGTVFYLSQSFKNPRVEIYDPKANSWSSYDSPRVVNDDQTEQIRLTELKSGNVLMAGGFRRDWEPWSVPFLGYSWSNLEWYLRLCWDHGTKTDPVAECDLFDGKTKQWKETGPLLQPRMFHATTLLNDGRILVTGGVDSDGNLITTCEIGTITENP